MKGFYIEVSNDLLDPKHCHTMGDAVWLFMWFLDKMTIIDSDLGEGKVLGGKPIVYTDLEIDLGISRSTFFRWSEILKQGGYIRTLRTPRGQVITVLKAKKRFGRSVKSDTSLNKKRCSKNDTSVTINDTSMLDYDTSNIDSTIDKSVDKNIITSQSEVNVKEIIDLFKLVNPNYQTLFPRKTERDAVERMLKRFGREKLEKAIKVMAESYGKKFAPTITTPRELESRMGKLIAYYKREQTPHNNAGAGITI